MRIEVEVSVFVTSAFNDLCNILTGVWLGVEITNVFWAVFGEVVDG